MNESLLEKIIKKGIKENKGMAGLLVTRHLKELSLKRI